MSKYFDKEQFFCLNCGHRWILASDRPITAEQHWEWIKQSIKEHDEISKEQK